MATSTSINGTARFGSEEGHELVLATIRDHAGSLLRTARRYSLCADDAQDAYQRALEIFVRRAHSLDPDGAAPWLRTVVKHEAMAVRAARASLVGPAEVDLDQHEATRLQTPDERIASFDRLTRSAEALQRLKPQEVRALVLRAQGHSYDEICELTGWTYTNRSCSVGPSTRRAVPVSAVAARSRSVRVGTPATARAHAGPRRAANAAQRRTEAHTRDS
jgi:RNA polymerase sigma factor (sigma-70 family)